MNVDHMAGFYGKAKASVLINAPASRVWEALTDPESVKRYLFGTDVESDWKAGSLIRWRGRWEGKEYEDKGNILESIPGKRLVYTYWSSISKVPDAPENYKKITCTLENNGGNTVLTIIQDNNRSEEERKHSESNWKIVAQKIKEICEG